jgi:hypothetical protein
LGNLWVKSQELQRADMLDRCVLTIFYEAQSESAVKEGFDSLCDWRSGWEVDLGYRWQTSES